MSIVTGTDGLIDWDQVQSSSVRNAVRGLLRNEKIAVIGARGRLGRALVAAASEASGVRVLAIDVSPFSAREATSQLARHVVADVRNEATLVELMQGITVVFLCSAVIDLNPWSPNAARIHDVNVGGAANTLRAARQVGARALCFTSSIDAQLTHRDGGDILNGDETHPPWSGDERLHMNHYSLTKARAEKVILDGDCGDSTGLRTAAIRPAHIYAAGDPMLEFARTLSRTPVLRNFWLVTRGTVHDVVYVENLALAHILLASKLLAGGAACDAVAGEAFLVSDGAMNLNDQIADFFPRGSVRPRYYVPRALIIAIAYVVELALFVFSGLLGLAPRDPAQFLSENA
jgi:nucleoside-diphosphate-sugar epimerase